MAPSPGAAGCCFDRFCLSHPLPCKDIPAENVSGVSVRDRSGPGKATAAVGTYLRVSGPQGRLRACNRGQMAPSPGAAGCRSKITVSPQRDKANNIRRKGYTIIPSVLTAEQIKALVDFAEQNSQPVYTTTQASIPEFEADDGSIVPTYGGLMAYSES